MVFLIASRCGWYKNHRQFQLLILCQWIFLFRQGSSRVFWRVAWQKFRKLFTKTWIGPRLSSLNSVKLSSDRIQRNIDEEEVLGSADTWVFCRIPVPFLVNFVGEGVDIPTQYLTEHKFEFASRLSWIRRVFLFSSFLVFWWIPLQWRGTGDPPPSVSRVCFPYQFLLFPARLKSTLNHHFPHGMCLYM